MAALGEVLPLGLANAEDRIGLSSRQNQRYDLLALKRGRRAHAYEEADLARINFIELPVRDIAAAQSFYTSAFNMKMTGFGPTYACTITGDVDLGLQGDVSEMTRAPLAVIEVADLEAALSAFLEAGGMLTKPIFSFPGGRRFHFADPSGNELAAMQVG